MAGRTRGHGGVVLVLILALALLAAACGDDSSVFGLGNDTSTTAAGDQTTVAGEPTTTGPQPEPTTTTKPQPEPTTTTEQQPQQTTTTTTQPPPTAVLLPSSQAYYSEFTLISGFIPDPWQYGPANAGSTDPVDVSYLGNPSCYGYANDIPDFELSYTAGSQDLLRLYFVADDPSDDTVLIINDPVGQWHCNDDSWSTYNPTLDFAFPASGVYDIWIGTYHEGELIRGTFYVTEVDANHP